MKRWLPALLLIVLLAGFRVLGSMYAYTIPNFQPLPALLLCGLVFLKGPERWLLPVAAWLITDPLTSLAQGYPILGWHNLSVILGFGVIAGIALWTRRHAKVLPVLLSAAAAGLAFHLATNLVSFTVDPRYAKTLTGLVQCEWSGLPTDALPTWMFLRNLMAANVLFTGLFLAARMSLPKAAPAATPNGALAR